jgi:AdoMet-dependent heme synthase
VTEPEADLPPVPGGFRDTFWLQWHLTDACNLDCRHCYRDAACASSEPALEVLEDVLVRYERFLAALGVRGRIQFGGGEPLISRNLLPLLRRARARGIPCRVLSNGTLVTDALAVKLFEAGARIVQVSLDGGRERHDELRGAGAFERALAGIERLARAGVEVTVAATLSRRNVADIEVITRAAVGAGAYRIAFSRLVPRGAAAALREEILEPAAWLAAQVTMIEVARREGIALMPRDPTFLCVVPGAAPRGGGGCREQASGCAAGFNGLAIDPDGSVYPCRRLPLPLGSIFEDDFAALWVHPELSRLRDRDALLGACGRCELRWLCGGCRAIPFALGRDMMDADPQCPRLAGLIPRGVARTRQAWHRFRWERC